MTAIARKLVSELSEWAKAKDRKPLLLRGARQVGKSYAVQEWARQNSLRLVTLNFEENPRLANIFADDLNALRIIDEITISTGAPVRSPGTVLFFDEIQKAPNAITALRYFYEKAPEVLILAAGSLVEFIIEELGVPVGRVQSHFVHPLSFCEFLDALEKNSFSQLIQQFSIETPQKIPQILHDELLYLLKLYYRIGGMPKVVATYKETRDLAKVSVEQSILIRGYLDDFRKYARKTDWHLLETIFHKMRELAGGSHIKFSAISREEKSTQVRRALDALQKALLIHLVRPVTSNKLPLAAHALDKNFKLTFLDLGLLHYLLGFDWRIVDEDADLTDIADGRIAEQFVAQELLASCAGQELYPLHYWARSTPGSEAEVDFLVEQKNQGIPVEVKSGVKGRLKSLEQFHLAFSPPRSIVLSQRNVEQIESVLFLPLYLAGRLHC